MEYELLIELIYKTLDCKLGSLDDLSSSSVKLMNGIVQGITFNWVKYIFNKVCEFIVAAKPKDEPLIGDKFLHKVGYGLMIYEILRKKRMRLRKQNNVGDYRVFFIRFGPDYRKKESHSKLFEGGDLPVQKLQDLEGGTLQQHQMQVSSWPLATPWQEIKKSSVQPWLSYHSKQ
nr:uncharacterized protein LOC109192376 [Ipomoea trifida]